MNKKRMFVLLACLGIMITGLSLYKSAKDNEIMDCITFSSHVKFNYNELEEAADIIALVKVKDKLTKENSTIKYIDGTPYILHHYSIRELEVLEYYKDTLDQGNILKVIEEAAITKNNEYLHDEGYQTLEKGQKYIVYLSKDNGLDSLSIISTNNGRINLAEFDKNEFTDIAVKSILKAENINFKKNGEFKL